jgi:hypothetical protein
MNERSQVTQESLHSDKRRRKTIRNHKWGSRAQKSSKETEASEKQQKVPSPSQLRGEQGKLKTSCKVKQETWWQTANSSWDISSPLQQPFNPVWALWDSDCSCVEDQPWWIMTLCLSTYLRGQKQSVILRGGPLFWNWGTLGAWNKGTSMTQGTLGHPATVLGRRCL